MKTVTQEREQQIRDAHAAYAAEPEIVGKDGFLAIDDLLTIIDQQRSAGCHGKMTLMQTLAEAEAALKPFAQRTPTTELDRTRARLALEAVQGVLKPTAEQLARGERKDER